MNLFNRTSTNPALKRLDVASDQEGVSTETVSVTGVSLKTALLLALALGTASWVWSLGSHPDTYDLARTLTIVGFIGGLVFALGTIFVQRVAPITAPIYALLEGLFLGGISVMYESSAPGIVTNAGLLTTGLFTAILGAYATGIVRVTGRYRALMGMAIMGIMLAYVANFILGMFGSSVPFLHSSGMVGLGISVFIVAIATLSLAVDFDNIQELEDRGAPKRAEWYLALSLMIGLVWLYIEVLRLLARRD